jgi:ribA/ribD-fused uncharacterized protein
MRITDTHIYFYKSWLSNWTPKDLDITYNGLKFTNSEQLYMWHKAQYFRDYEIGTRIVNEGQNPKIALELGRQVKNYDDKKWSKLRDYYMYLAVKAKFESSNELMLKLMNTGDKILVEASLTDKLWGIGIDENDDTILDENNWQGLNLLGIVLMKVRNEFFLKKI